MDKLYIDFNCDLGELEDGGLSDSRILPFVTSINIACGYHAGSKEIMERTVSSALKLGCNIGAHPGFPDRENFGRTEMMLSHEEIRKIVRDQVIDLKTICDKYGESIKHVKPHGAMYNMAAKDERLALAIAEAVAQIDDNLFLVGLSGSELLKAAKRVGLKCASEVFADRAYEDDGSLVPRSKIGAVISNEEEASDRAVQMIKYGKVKSITGKEIPITADTICIHGDTPQALHLARIMRAKFAREMIEIEAL